MFIRFHYWRNEKIWTATFEFDRATIDHLKKLGWRWDPAKKRWWTYNSMVAFAGVTTAGETPCDDWFRFSKNEWRKLGFRPTKEHEKNPTSVNRIQIAGRKVDQYLYVFSQVEHHDFTTRAQVKTALEVARESIVAV